MPAKARDNEGAILRWLRLVTITVVCCEACFFVGVLIVSQIWGSAIVARPVASASIARLPTAPAVATARPSATPLPTIAPQLAAAHPATPTPTPMDVHLDQVKNAVQAVVAAHPELTIGVSFIDLNTGTRVDVNGDHVFTAASTTKVFVACLLLSQVESGRFSLGQSLGGSTVGEQLRQMINQSNNDSWMSLMSFIGYGYQPPYAAKLGITTYDYNNNRISPNDQALLLQKLYAGQLLNKTDTSLLLSYMRHTNMEDLIPPAVPSGVQVFHKYGDYEDNLHDAAVIDDGKNPFVLTIYTSDGDQQVSYLPRYAVFHDIVSAVEKEMGIGV